MKPRIFFFALTLVAVLLASCAPQATPPPAPAQANPTLAALPLENAIQPPATDAQALPAVAATSRGDNLEASDPATVSLASGELQLVEFFRFT